MIDLPCVQLTPTGARAEFTDLQLAGLVVEVLAAFGLTVTQRIVNHSDDPFVPHVTYGVEVTYK